MTIKELGNFIYENYYSEIGFTKELLFNKTSEDLPLFATKLIEKIPNLIKTKECHHSYVKNKKQIKW